MSNRIRWWKKAAFPTDLARRRAGRFQQPQLQESSWNVVGEHGSPPHSIHRSLFLTVQKWGKSGAADTAVPHGDVARRARLADFFVSRQDQFGFGFAIVY